MDLEIVAAWAEVFGLVTILGAAIYSWYQIREDPTNKDLEWMIWLVDRVIEYEDAGSGTKAAWYEFKDWAPPLRK